MINIVFCIGEGRYQWIEDEFGFDSVTRFVDYRDTVRLLNSFLSDAQHRDLKNTSTQLLLKYKGETHLIDIHKICYIEVTKRIVDVHVGESGDISYKAYAPLCVLEKALSHLGFVRVSRYYVVSVEHIRRICGMQIRMDDGEDIPVGRSYKKKLLALLRGEQNVLIKG